MQSENVTHTNSAHMWLYHRTPFSTTAKNKLPSMSMKPLHLSATTAYTPEGIQELLTEFVQPDKTVESVSLEVRGEMIPILHAEELGVVSRILSVVHNKNVQTNLQVILCFALKNGR